MSKNIRCFDKEPGKKQIGETLMGASEKVRKPQLLATPSFAETSELLAKFTTCTERRRHERLSQSVALAGISQSIYSTRLNTAPN